MWVICVPLFPQKSRVIYKWSARVECAWNSREIRVISVPFFSARHLQMTRRYASFNRGQFLVTKQTWSKLLNVSGWKYWTLLLYQMHWSLIITKAINAMTKVSSFVCLFIYLCQPEWFFSARISIAWRRQLETHVSSDEFLRKYICVFSRGAKKGFHCKRQWMLNSTNCIKSLWPFN